MKKEPIDNNIIAHTSWNCKYHIVFAPKYRRKVFFEEKRLEIREILRQLCQWKGVEIIEGVALQAPQSMEFSRQEYWGGLPFPSPEDLPDPGIEPRSLALQTDSLPSEPRQAVRWVREACLIILGSLARRG